MDFNSYLFVLVFLPMTVVIYHFLNGRNNFTLADIFLLAMSIWFYCYAGSFAILIILASIVVNYFISHIIVYSKFGSSRQDFAMSENNIKFAAFFSKAFLTPVFWLIIGIVFNLGVLLYFKYTGYFLEILSEITKHNYGFKSVFIPLGISYITFSQLAYLIDSYRSKETASYSLLNYSLYVLFFPKIAVGPIALPKTIIKQFQDVNRRTVSYNNLSKGIVSFSFGLAKKMLIADNLASIVNWGYGCVQELNSIEAILVMLSYTMQLYFDFSGYCDMANGMCLMLNIELPINFNSPYRALSVDDFWKRWHITLTSFFREYVYFPLGGNRKGRMRTYLNIFIIFVLSGIWHGANVTFIVWGVVHGIFMCISKAGKSLSEKLPRVVRFIMTFTYINFTWIIFRSKSISEAILFMKRIFTGGIGKISVDMSVAGTMEEGQLLQWFIIESTKKIPYVTSVIMMLLLIGFSTFASIFMKNTYERIEELKQNRRTMVITVVLLVWSVISLSKVSQFIYVNF